MMNKHFVHVCSAAMLAGVLSTGLLAGKDKDKNKENDKAEVKDSGGQMDPAKMAEMMKKAEEAGAPGDAHKKLEPLIGEWTAEVQCWMDPGSPPMVSKGAAKAEWVMKGRFVKEEFDGEMMGKPFQGMSLTGYDNQKKHYSTLWVDDTSTALFMSAGTADKGGRVITFESKMDCPVTGEKDMPVKQVLHIVSPDKHVFEMHHTRQGKEAKVMEITYTRK